MAGFEYAYGEYDILNGKPASAFSKGDVLIYTSASSLSRADVLFPSGAEIVGVALSSSTESYRDLVPFVKALPSTVFRASLETAMEASDVTVGWEKDVGQDQNTAHYSVTSSENSVRVVIVDIDEVDHTRISDRSYVLVRFLSAGGETEWL